MLKNNKINSFIKGFICYFVLDIILNLFGLDTFIVRAIIAAITILIGFFIYYIASGGKKR